MNRLLWKPDGLYNTAETRLRTLLRRILPKWFPGNLLENPSVEIDVEGWGIAPVARDGLDMTRVELHCPIPGCRNAFEFLTVDPDKALARCGTHDISMVRRVLNPS